ncbi:translation initiation factor IF-2 [archaeon SCG-AAA382B04]|nr:translation initiation factor IF-2 [archaeon SCG-AAA382B04]
MSKIRTPIVVLLGHVDHGKTTTLDKIRGTTVAERESGDITQHIGATEVPLQVIDELCGSVVNKENFKVPGLLFIDTPGHQAFTSLRSRGGSLADLAVVVVDINDGFQPQTYEALDILQDYKTPFVVAANKIDKIPGWNPNQNEPFLKTYQKQNKRTKENLNEKLYEIVGHLQEKGFDSDRYDRVKNFKQNIGLVPISAKTGEGIPDLLMVQIGLAQRYIEDELGVEEKSHGKGTILEIKEERGLGKTLDVILYDGKIEVGDEILIGGYEEPIETKVRSLLKPRPMEEIRESGSEFEKVDRVNAAAGVKVVAPDLDKALAGFPLHVVDEKNKQKIREKLKSKVDEVLIKTEIEGIIVKATTIGSLEAIVNDLKERDIDIRRADIGDVSRRDVVEAETVENPLEKTILAFEVDVLKEARKEAEREGITIFSDDVIYRLIKDYEGWIEKKKKLQKKKKLENVIKPGKFKILPDHTFRQCKPAIVGIKVLSPIKTGYPLMNKDGETIGQIKEIQDQGESIKEAKPGDEVAVSISGPIVGRQIKEGEILYVDIPEKHGKIIEEQMKDLLTEREKKIFEEIAEIKRKDNKFWGI